MAQYSFLKESSVDKILAMAGMTTLGSTTGEAAGSHVGELASRFSTRKLSADDISWTNPIFISIVRKDLLEAQNKIKLAREWYNSCDAADKMRAKIDYNNAVLEYKQIQKDISDRRADRWLEDYKSALAVSNSQRVAKAGKIIGGTGALAATAYKLLKK